MVELDTDPITLRSSTLSGLTCLGGNLRFTLSSLLALVVLSSVGIAIWHHQTRLAKVEEEEHIFNHIISGHQGMFALAIPKGGAWPIFLKFTDKNVVVYSNRHTGWCNEVPGYPIETLKFITVGSLNSEQVELKFQGQTKTIKLDSGEAGHYYGR
jgi:hypothetical protein